MIADELDDPRVTEPERIQGWRYDALREAGVGKEVADALAARFDIDLHVAVEMALNGCPDKLLAEILL